MNFAQISQYLKEAEPQANSPEFQKWLELTDALAFLVQSSDEQVPIYITAKHFFLYTVLVPKNKLKGNYVNNLLHWNISITGYGYGYGFDPITKQAEKFLSPPIDQTGSSILDGGEALVFHRSLYHNNNTYLELNQRLTHVLDIHRVNQRSAYCKVDDETGDLVNVVSYTDEESTICTIDRKSLDFYMFLTDTVLVQLFDVTRWQSGSFSGWHDADIKSTYKDKKNHLYAQRVQNMDENGLKKAAYLRGFHLIRPKQSEKQMLAELTGQKEKKKKYVSVIAIDFKHGKTCKCSCDPLKLGNYFVESDLPYGTSPAFFRPEVLLRYKHDTDKYEIGSGSITCRGAWWLRYNTNDAGQIQLYLKDLSSLPYPEQLYWQSFNEKPKAGVAEVVIKRDFYGEWASSPDPLEELKHTLKDFPSANYRGEKVAILRHPTEKQLAKLTYVVNDSINEWEDQILALAKVLGDGLSKTELRKIARYLKCDDPQLGSIKLLRNCLEAKGLSAADVETIIPALQSLFLLRSTIVAHEGKSAPDEDLKMHHKKLVIDCEKAMRHLAELIRAGTLDVPS